MDAVEIALIVAFFGCVSGAAVLSLAEVSIIRLRRTQLLVGQPRDDPRSRRLLRLLDELPIVLNSVLLVVLFLQVGASAIGGFLANRWFGGYGLTVATILMTMLLFVYAEAIPKTVAVRSPHRTALLVLPLLVVLVKVLRPFVGVLVRLANLQSPGPPTSPGALKEEEIRALARESAAAGEITAGDAALVDRSFEFNDRRVVDVMVPRERIAAIEGTQTVSEAAARAVSLGHRRLPVYGADIDDIIGVLRLRDVVSLARRDQTIEAGSVAGDVMRCRPQQMISEVLREMQRTGHRLAIVIAPDGRTQGLVTVEDVVAELVGEIADDDPDLDV